MSEQYKIYLLMELEIALQLMIMFTYVNIKYV